MLYGSMQLMQGFEIHQLLAFKSENLSQKTLDSCKVVKDLPSGQVNIM